ncbi:GlcG/HbpS family heme-binding protein [Pseudomonas sp. SED1]|uniref:GlcG/HbpS family heme-binding protein n=1 Tax=Pseudomonas sp. SED1 TaxID=3056845 RepID=UPI00296EF653|nr:heme-binding protein [Pseudomonas sp. SED1]MDY0834181.1 heme-binding protein [Pseudomonas sp. SED1]
MSKLCKQSPEHSINRRHNALRQIVIGVGAAALMLTTALPAQWERAETEATPSKANQHLRDNPAFITSEAAQQMADAAEQAAQQAGFNIAISIMDNHGSLKYFKRMDNTSVGSIEVAHLKASTSAKFPVSTQNLATRSAKLPGNPYAAIPGMLLLGGGVPIINKAGEHLGGIGISGATPELDARFAHAAVAHYRALSPGEPHRSSSSTDNPRARALCIQDKSQLNPLRL